MARKSGAVKRAVRKADGLEKGATASGQAENGEPPEAGANAEQSTTASGDKAESQLEPRRGISKELLQGETLRLIHEYRCKRGASEAALCSHRVEKLLEIARCGWANL